MKVILNPDKDLIDFSDNTLSAFFSDGRGYVRVTKDIATKIFNGELVITEYHEEPLGNVIYLSASAPLN